MRKLLDDARAAGFKVESDKVNSDTFHINITEKLAKFAALQKPQWVSVKDKLPDDEIYVLVKVGSNWHPIRIMKRVNVLEKCKWVNEDNSTLIYDHFITHWMPLPSLPINT